MANRGGKPAKDAQNPRLVRMTVTIGIYDGPVIRDLAEALVPDGSVSTYCYEAIQGRMRKDMATLDKQAKAWRKHSSDIQRPAPEPEPTPPKKTRRRKAD